MLREIELSKALGPRVLEPTQEDSQAVHTPLKDGPAGVGDNKNVAMLWRKPLLEGVCLVLGADHVEASGTCCSTSRGILVPQRQGRKAFEVGHGGFVEELVRYGSGGPLSEKVGSHGLRKKRHGDQRPSLSWAMEVLGGADVCGRGVETTPANRGLGPAAEVGVPAPKTPSSILVEAVAKGPTEIGGALPAGGLLGGRPKAATLWVKSAERKVDKTRIGACQCLHGPQLAAGPSQGSQQRFPS